MTTYKLFNDASGNVNTSAILRNDGACIPFDEANTDYQEYLKWLAEGGVPTPAENT